MNNYLKTIFSVFQSKSTEPLVEDVSYSTEISYKNVLFGSLTLSLLFVIPLIFTLGPFGLALALPTALAMFIGSFIGIFINAAFSALVLKIAKGSIEYKKIVNLFAYFLGLAGIPMLFNIIPVVGSVLAFVASVFLFYLQMKCLSKLSEVSIVKLAVLHIAIGMVLSLILMLGAMVIGFASFGALL